MKITDSERVAIGAEMDAKSTARMQILADRFETYQQAFIAKNPDADPSEALVEVLDALRPRGERAYRGYLLAANAAGWPVDTSFVPAEQLEQFCTRAFWWTFEQIVNKRPVKEIP